MDIEVYTDRYQLELAGLRQTVTMTGIRIIKHPVRPHHSSGTNDSLAAKSMSVVGVITPRAQCQKRYFLFAAASFLICSITGPSSFSAAASSALSCSGGQRRSVCWMAWNIWRVSGNGAQP